MITIDSLQFRVLDSLVNAPSSVAGVYGDLVYLLGYTSEILGPLRRACDELERREWVICRLMTPRGEFAQASNGEREARWTRYATWLRCAARDELALDEVGLWYGITDQGRKAWEAWASRSHREFWQLDDDLAAGQITVTSETAEIAERMLQRWLDMHPTYRVMNKRASASGRTVLQSGQVIEQGVTLVCSYVPETAK